MLAASTWEVFSSLGSLVAALTAIGALIYVEHIKPNRRRPRLVPFFDSERVEYEATVKPHGVTEHWLRVRIAAERDRDSAEDVEVIFVGLNCQTDDEAFPTEPRCLRWSATTITPFVDGRRIDPLSHEAPEPLTQMRLPAGSYRYVDVLHATSNPHLDATQCRTPRICARPFHPDRHTLRSGDYNLYFAVTGTNVDTVYFRLPVSWDGRWSDDDDEWFSHLSVAGVVIESKLPADL